MKKLKIALQKSGRLHEESIKFLKDCGININLYYSDKLRVEAINFPMDVFFLRDDDIPKYIQEGVADIGIVGKNIVFEQKKNILIKEKLGFGICRLSIAVPKDTKYKNVEELDGKRIATSYPNLLKKFLEEHNMFSYVVNISGSVEIATNIGIADAIFDLVSSGETLLKNNLKEIKQMFSSEAVLLCCPKYEQKTLVKQLLFRIQAVKRAITNKYILFYAPNKKLDNIFSFLMKKLTMASRPPIKPAILTITDSKYSYVQAIVEDYMIWKTISFLERNGVKYLTVHPIQKFIIDENYSNFHTG